MDSQLQNKKLKKKLESTRKIQTSANAICYAKAYASKNVKNIHQQLFQFIFNA